MAAIRDHAGIGVSAGHSEVEDHLGFAVDSAPHCVGRRRCQTVSVSATTVLTKLLDLIVAGGRSLLLLLEDPPASPSEDDPSACLDRPPSSIAITMTTITIPRPPPSGHLGPSLTAAVFHIPSFDGDLSNAWKHFGADRVRLSSVHADPAADIMMRGARGPAFLRREPAGRAKESVTVPIGELPAKVNKSYRLVPELTCLWRP